MDLPIEKESLRRTTETHETWVDKLIVDAQERGVFNNLSCAGKPLSIQRAPYAGERELGYGILKNAGFAPLWVEIDKGIRAELDVLASIRARASALNDENESRQVAFAASKSSFWRRFFGLSESTTRFNRSAGSSSEGELSSLRREYLVRAEKLDKQIELFNATLPRDLWWVERPRLTPEIAAREFDDAVAGVDDGMVGT